MDALARDLAPDTDGDPAAAIRARAVALGFDTVGFAPAALPEAVTGRLREYLRLGRHGDMDWMETTAGRRGDPRSLWPEARSVVMLGMNYAPASDPLALVGKPERGSVSVYARGADYHDLVKKRLKALGRWMADAFGGPLKVFVDTAPVMEKPLAQQAGLGWQGKHTNMVSRDFGSWLFLGAIYTTLDLPPDTAEPDHCGGCRRCLDICPTDAFPAPYQLDARRCISYLTIEHKGQVPAEFREAIGNRIFGCDDCLAVCPWNKFAQRTRELQFHPRIFLTAPRLKDLVRLDDAAFRRVFAGSPVKRLGRDRFIRNVLIAIGNSGETALVPDCERLLADPSPLVRGMAVWALARLCDGRDFARLRARWRNGDPDRDVQQEWDVQGP